LFVKIHPPLVNKIFGETEFQSLLADLQVKTTKNQEPVVTFIPPQITSDVSWMPFSLFGICLAIIVVKKRRKRKK